MVQEKEVWPLRRAGFSCGRPLKLNTGTTSIKFKNLHLDCWALDRAAVVNCWLLMTVAELL